VAGRLPSASALDPNAGRIQVPKHTKDPIWSLKPWPVLFTVNDQDYEIPALPAVDWLTVLMKEEFDLSDVIFELLPDGVSLFGDENIDLNDLYDACLDVIEAVTSRHWWIAIGLIGVAQANWNIVGVEMMLHGIKAEEVSISAWLDALLVITLSIMDKDKTTAFIMRLEKPPPGEEVPAEELEMSRDEFMSMMR
jgi:hypothetical protein